MNSNTPEQEILTLKARLLDALDAHRQDSMGFQQTVQSIALAVDPLCKEVKLDDLIQVIHAKFAEGRTDVDGGQHGLVEGN